MEVLPDATTVEQLQKKLIDDPKDPVILFLLTDEKKRLDIFSERKSTSKCLHCLGSDVEAIQKVEPDRKESGLNPIWHPGLKLRGCGGNLFGLHGPTLILVPALKSLPLMLRKCWKSE
jgi:hypothetical protein